MEEPRGYNILTHCGLPETVEIVLAVGIYLPSCLGRKCEPQLPVEVRTKLT